MREAKKSPLGGNILLLNRFYMAVHVISVRRGLVLLYRELAEVIHVERGRFSNHDFESWLEISEFFASEPNASSLRDFVRSVNFQIEVPRVLRLFGYEKAHNCIVRFNRRNLFARDANRCQYCGQKFPFDQLSFDHVIPQSRGGKTTWENVVCCCLRCNGRKGNRTPEEAAMRLIRRPCKPKTNPILTLKLQNPKYESWRSFLGGGPAAFDFG